MRLRLKALALLTPLFALASACKPSPRHSPAQTGPRDLEKKFFIPAGKFAEINLEMPAGAEAVADYAVEEGGTIEWNVHSHPPGREKDEDAMVYDEGDGPKGGFSFRAPEDGVFSYLFENKKGRKAVIVRVKLTLSGGARVKSMVP